MPRTIEQGESVGTAFDNCPRLPLPSPRPPSFPLLSSPPSSRSDCENARGVLTETIRA